MDCELVNNSQSDNDEKQSYTDVFEKMFSYYLSIGMTEEQYWDKDSCLVKFYREAEKLRNDKFNQQAWLQGMYIYDAIARLSPILRSFGKKGTKAKPYVDEPYPLNDTQHREKETKKIENKGLLYMQSFMMKNNKKFKKE